MISDNIESSKEIEIHYLKNGLAKSKILLLHGYSFNANTWKDLKTMEILEEEGFGAIALDFPGFGKSGRLKGLDYSAYPLKSDKDIKTSIEFLEGFIENIASEQDVIDLKNMIKNSVMIQYLNAGHPCYLDVPDLFHRDLLKFLRK